MEAPANSPTGTDVATPRPVGANRAVFDFLKGIGILEVVMHHSLSHSASRYVVANTLEYWICRWGNRILHFAVPMFLLVSACLLTRSLLGRNDVKRFAQRRISRSLWPYLIWSLFYLCVRVFIQKNASDIKVMTATWPLIGPVTGYRAFVDLPNLVKSLLWGKAYFHLYFMSVLLQMSIVLPFVALAMKKVKLSFLGALAASVVLQLGAFIFQRDVLRFFAPASTVMWYLPALILGSWIGANWSEWPSVWKRQRGLFAGLAVFGTVRYLYLEHLVFSKQRIVSLDYNSTFLVYSISLALILVGLGPTLVRRDWTKWVRLFGQHSLPIFIIHPFVLYGLRGPSIGGLITRMPLSPLVCIVLVLALSYAFARTIAAFAERTKWKVDQLLFGQDLPRRNELSIAKAVPTNAPAS